MIEPIVTGIMRGLFRPLLAPPAGQGEDSELSAGTYLVIGQDYLVGSSGEFLILG